MDIISNCFLHFFDKVIMPLLLPFMIIALILSLAAGRYEKLLQTGFDLLGQAIIWSIKLAVKLIDIICKKLMEPEKSAKDKKNKPSHETVQFNKAAMNFCPNCARLLVHEAGKVFCAECAE